jgi:hypothetical protein
MKRKIPPLIVLAMSLSYLMTGGAVAQAPSASAPPQSQKQTIKLTALEGLILAYGRAIEKRNIWQAEVTRLEALIAKAKAPRPNLSPVPRTIGPTREEVLSEDAQTSGTKAERAPQSEQRPVIGAVDTFLKYESFGDLYKRVERAPFPHFPGKKSESKPPDE